jgi:hypothetical protein
LDKHRRNRIRRLVSRLNKVRRTQAKKIDMLCNDIIPAHNGFIKRLNSFRFAADFYETVIGIDNLDRMLEVAGENICSEMNDLNLAIILAGPEPIISHHSTTSMIDINAHGFTGYITDKLIKNICQSNKICTLDDMLGMELAANPVMLKKLSIAAIPLSRVGPPVGVILLYRSAENPLRTEELSRIASVTIGLGKAIMLCRNQTQKKNFKLEV